MRVASRLPPAAERRDIPACLAKGHADENFRSVAKNWWTRLQPVRTESSNWSQRESNGGAEARGFGTACPLAGEPFVPRGDKMVELPGIEPGSPDREAKAATCLACHLFSPCDLRQTGSRRTSRLKFRPYPAGGVRTILPALRPCGPKARHHRNTQNCPGHGLVRLAN